MTGKHDTLCEIISADLTERGWNVENYINYKAFENGEIDILAEKNGYYIDIECKCNNTTKNRNKAIKQLGRAKKYFQPYKHNRVFTFYAYYKPSSLIEYTLEWII